MNRNIKVTPVSIVVLLFLVESLMFEWIMIHPVAPRHGSITIPKYLTGSVDVRAIPKYVDRFVGPRDRLGEFIERGFAPAID